MTDGRHTLFEWQQNATETLARNQRTRDHYNLSSRFRNAATSVRPVTPEPVSSAGLSESDNSRPEALDVSPLQPVSPKVLPGGENPIDKRQGLVFQDTTSFGHGALEQPASTTSSRRSRTRTLEETYTTTHLVPKAPRTRHRIGSLHSAQAAGYCESELRDISASAVSSVPVRVPTLSHRTSSKSRKSSAKRLLKRSVSRPSSPLALSPRPSVDSLAYPINTGDPNKILGLMGSLNGRMKGPIEYQLKRSQPWFSGVCYIDEVKGSLMYEGTDRGPFHQSIIPDLRGSRTKPIFPTVRDEARSIEISSTEFQVLIVPLVAEDFDLWLSALLYWQQIRVMSPSNLKNPEPLLFGEMEKSKIRSDSNITQAKDASIIKIGNVLLWDDGTPMSPSPTESPTERRTAARDPTSAHRFWHRVSCTLQDDGEFKLLTENDNSFLAVIHLKQLSRHGVQPLEKSVLNKEFGIVIYPVYTSDSCVLSIIRPIYIALDSRVLFEVWFVLLRAFCAPEIYGPRPERRFSRASDYSTTTTDKFRIERSLGVRVTEAKMRRGSLVQPNDTSQSRHAPQLEDPSMGDYFSEVMLDSEVVARTMVKTKTRNPFWREDCQFQNLPSTLTEISITLKKKVASDSGSAPDQMSESIRVCGSVVISIDKLEKNVDHERWWPMLDDKGQSIGDILLKLRYEELVVLMSKDYQPVLELLDRFSNGLTVQIAQSIPAHLRRLAEIFVNIFQVSGKSSEWLTGLIEEEIDGISKETSVSRIRFNRRVASNDSLEVTNDRELIVRDLGKSLTGEANLLFRGNSLLTQALDFHMKRVGKEYLEEVLSESINQIDATNPDCEVDPSRIASSDDLERNWDQLRSLTTGVWNSIRSSVSNCPSEVRILLKHVRSCADSRYGDFLRTVPYTSVTGFLFLRFFCPAILNPKLFGLLPDHPQPKAQRTLTLIAKSLQVLANLSTFGQKESWMEPMNRFLTGHRQAVKDFIDELCSLPTERGGSFAVPASYSTPITILARLPPLSKEGFPSLPYLIDHPKNFAALIKLWLDCTSPHANGFEGDLLEFHKLCTSLQRRTNDCLQKAYLSDPYGDSLSQWEQISTSLANIASPSSKRTFTRRSPSPSPSPPRAYSPNPPHDPTLQSATTLSHFLFTDPQSSSQTQITTPGSSGSDTASSRKAQESRSLWEAALGSAKDGKFQLQQQQRTYDFPAEQSGTISPPNRGPSRDGRQRSFLSSLRKKKGSGESTGSTGPLGSAFGTGAEDNGQGGTPPTGDANRDKDFGAAGMLGMDKEGWL